MIVCSRRNWWSPKSPTPCGGVWLRAKAIRSRHRPTVASLPRFFNRLFGLASLGPKAVAIAAELSHPVYDCFYLALAESEDTMLVTADRRLIGRLAGSAWERRCRPLVG
jgi:predicted nucleic acid-binding protein